MNELLNKFPEIIKRLLEQISTENQTNEEIKNAQEKLKYQLNNIMDEFNILLKGTQGDKQPNIDPMVMIMKMLGGAK